MTLGHLGTFLSSLVFPLKCLGCGAQLPFQNQKTAHHKRICEECAKPYEIHNKTLNDNISVCNTCGTPTHVLDLENKTCLACRANPLAVEHLRHFSAYTDLSQRLVCAYKYRHIYALTDILSKTMTSALCSLQNELAYCWDLIVPIPSSLQSVRSRGFAHTAFIARKVANQANIPYSFRALQSKGSRKPQVTLTPEERSSNMQFAFFAKSNLVKNKRILCLDDVVTTGSTICSAATALRSAGATSVDAIAILKSPNFQNNRIEMLLN